MSAEPCSVDFDITVPGVHHPGRGVAAEGFLTLMILQVTLISRVDPVTCADEILSRNPNILLGSKERNTLAWHTSEH